MLSTLAKILAILNSETRPGQISLALVFAMIMGLTPLFSMHNAVVLLLVLVLRTNLSMFLAALALFSALAYLFDPLFHQFGLWILKLEQLNALWTDMYNSGFWRMTRFNNSVLMGSLAASLILFVPMLLLSNMMIGQYRHRFRNWVNNWQLIKLIKSSKLYQVYQAVSGSDAA